MLMRMVSGLLAQGLAVLLALVASAVQAQPATGGTTGAAAKPKIVVQATVSAGIDVAAWSRDSAFVITASGLTREVLLWDVARQVIIDRLRLPAAANSTAETMQLRAMRLDADGRTLRIEGEVIDTSQADGRAGRAYTVDVISRHVEILPAPALAPLPAGKALARLLDWITALEVIYEDGTGMSEAEALAVLPELPASPDGRWQMVRAGPGFALKARNGEVRSFELAQALPGIDSAALSPDGRTLGIVHLLAAENSTTVDIYDLLAGRLQRQIELKGTHNRLGWIDRNRFVVHAEDGDDDPRNQATRGQPSPMLIVDAETGKVISEVEPRCFVRPLRDGSLVGAGLANCRRGVGSDRALVRLMDGKWTPFMAEKLPRNVHVRDIAASPRGDRVAVLQRQANKDLVISRIDLATGDYVGFILDASADIGKLGFSPDGRRIWLAGLSGVAEWLPDAPATADAMPTIRDFDASVLLPSALASDGRQLLASGPFEEKVVRIDIASGKTLPPLDFSGAAAVGFVPGRPLIWAASTFNGLRLWDSRTGAEILSTAFFEAAGFVTVAPDGRYDTNYGPDSDAFRWVAAIAPFESLAPQTFMRDFFEPRLTEKVTDCTAAGNCARTLKPLPSIAGLNRLLPVVQVTDVRLADEPGQVVVKVAVRETRDQRSDRSSGIYGVKLLLNDRQVEQVPGHFEQPPAPTLTEWREVNRITEVDAAGVWQGEFHVSVPTHHDGKPMQFAAYAFNSDRVKSDTARRAWTPPAPGVMAKRPRRAYVVTIGVDDYAEARLKLGYAVADARLIAGRLARIPGYEMRHISLTSESAPDGRILRQVTRDDIRGVLSYLAGFPPEMDQLIRLQDVHKVRDLDATSPDDIVIISFSGHGFADAAGKFALVPSNARWPMHGSGPDAATVISADDLSVWLGFMSAAEIAFIIDACHSGAAVATPDFKPGPMGDPGLGQLAFDKGLRILAATQAGDVALENSQLKLGFLTAALGEGLAEDTAPAPANKADTNSDGRVLLDEWLRYAVARLPSLHELVRKGGGLQLARGVLLEMEAPATPPRLQQPSLFDFNAAPSPVALRGQP